VKHTLRTTAALAILALAPASAALARTPYLLPNTFNPERPLVTLQAASTEDDYFNGDAALNIPAYVVTGPSGQAGELKPAAMLKDLAVVEAALADAGTYRFTSGDVVQRKNTFALVDGKWLAVRQPRPGEAPRPGAGPPPGDGPPAIYEANVPAGAKTMVSEQVMKVETYVSKGAPTEAALKTSGQGFELKPVTHPNAVYVDKGFSFQLLADGQPLANVPVAVYRSGNIYDDRRIAVELRTDAKGNGHVAFTQPGVYLLTTHYPVARPGPTETPAVHNYTYSLTFEVTR
jgi:hypothetical protein